MITRNKKKNFITMLITMGIFSLSSIYSIDLETHEAMCEFLTTQNKYINPEGKLERISFHSAKNADSTETILRDGFLLKRKNAKAVVFILNGFMCTKFESSFLRKLLFPEFHVVTFDFRAHGKNIDEYQCCTFGRDEANDVIAAVNHIRSREDLKDLPRIAYGFSMGAVAAIEAQASHPDLFDMMILDCPYDRSKNVIKKGLENIQFNFWGYTFALPWRDVIEKYAFLPLVQRIIKQVLKTATNMDPTAINTYIYPVHPVDSIKKVTVPCFFIHCKNDEKVPVEAAKNLFRNAAGHKWLWVTAGRGHFDSFFINPDKYGYLTHEFMHSVLDKTYTTKKQQKIIEDKYG